MKYKFLAFLLVVNEVSGLAIAATSHSQKAFGQTILGGIGTVVGLGILWLFARLGFFRGLKFKHYVFLLSCVLIAGAAGYFIGR
jgi:hypothetical protein